MRRVSAAFACEPELRPPHDQYAPRRCWGRAECCSADFSSDAPVAMLKWLCWSGARGTLHRVVCGGGGSGGLGTEVGKREGNGEVGGDGGTHEG
eukprot:scaffold24509_cov97-Isochrysis_galbana.AAC.4